MKKTKEEMRQLYAQWQQSGLSRQAFCKQENIHYATFHYWHKQFNQLQDGGFSEVSLAPPQTVSAELIFPSGVRMVFHSTPPVGWLKELVG
jgi:transposase